MSMLDEMKEGANGPFVCSTLLRWKWPMVYDSTHSLALHLSNASRLSSRELRQSRTCGDDTHVCLHCCNTSVAFWHALLPENEPIAMYPQRGEEEAGYMWQMKRAMCGTRRASRLFQKHMKGVLKEAGYAVLKVCHQVYHCLDTDSMAAPEALDELEEVEGKLYQQDTGNSIYVSSGRFDIQFCVKRLSEMVTKPRKLGNLRLARLARYLVGTEKLVFRFDHQEYGDTVRIAVDSDWAGSEERYSTHAGLEFDGEHLVDSWVASDQVRALSSREAELCGIVDGSGRGILTKHMYEEMGRTINIDVEMGSTAAIGM